MKANLDSARNDSNQVSDIQPIQLKSRKTHAFAKESKKESIFPESKPIEMISLKSARRTKVKNKIHLER